jgi:nanoRNase/pAp phosphatase (c-di-AMP/oligoRNAs hydrolase)
MQKQFRLVTRSDMDGLVCAVLLKEINLVDDILFVHPKDMQDGKIVITENDITTNLPYVDGVHIAFDHHFSETLRKEKKDNHIIIPTAPSAARVVYDYYGGSEKFPDKFLTMMDAVDKADAAQFSKEDILNPTGWDLLSFLMDARTGLGRFREFKISNYQLMMDLIDYCKDHDIDNIMELPDVKERVSLFYEHTPLAMDQIQRCSTVYDNLVVLDLREEETVYACNRFLIYALYSDCNISIHQMWGFKKQNIVFATGGSIVNRSCKSNIGELMLKYGGGGHEKAGTCQIAIDKADEVKAELIEVITANG